jgi:hypothetical protein
MKTLNQLTEQEYSQLYSSGELWDKYPAATGDKRKDLDCCITLQKLHKRLNDLYSEWYKDRNSAITNKILEKIQDLYNNNFLQCLQNEGLNLETAQIVQNICYEHGHSAGYSEVVNYAFEFIDIARRIIEANK